VTVPASGTALVNILQRRSATNESDRN
jgi:hypothetical protein